MGRRVSPEHTEADALLGLPSPVILPALCFHVGFLGVSLLEPVSRVS